MLKKDAVVPSALGETTTTKKKKTKTRRTEFLKEKPSTRGIHVPGGRRGGLVFRLAYGNQRVLIQKVRRPDMPEGKKKKKELLEERGAAQKKPRNSEAKRMRLLNLRGTAKDGGE